MALFSMERKASIFLFSCVLLSHVSARVPPATNVSLDCQNFINILRWDYIQHASLKPSFRVSVAAMVGTPEPLHVDYPDLQCDLSAFRRSDNEYRVQVTALVGLNQSLPAPLHGLTFSYFYASLVDQICTLDLPPVTVTFQSEEGIKFSFSHPSVLYGQKLLTNSRRQKKRNAVSEFEYSVVVTRNQSPSQEYSPTSCKTDVCEGVIPAGLQHDCVKVEGHWEKMVVRSTQDYCAPAPAAPAAGYQSLYIGLGVFFTVALVLVFAFFCKRITASSQRPFSLSFPQSNSSSDVRHDHSHTPLIPDRASLSPVSPQARSPADDDDVHLTLPAGDQNGGPAAPNGIAPGAPKAKADPARKEPGGPAGARHAGQGDPGVQPQVEVEVVVVEEEEPVAAAAAAAAPRDAGPLPPDAAVVVVVEEAEGAVGLEQLGVRNPDDAGYEQRVRVELSPGDTVDAYLG